jgi:hypothetical protein
MTRPISPKDIARTKAAKFPPEVIEIFNELIAMHYSSGTARVYQREAMALIKSRLNVEERVIVDKGWLSVEEIYQAMGWEVRYDKPAYNESYPAYYIFKIRA